MLWPEHLASCPRGNLLANVGDGSKVDVSECPADVRFGSKADIAVECAPDGGQVQAAVLTDCWAWWSSYCTGLM